MIALGSPISLLFSQFLRRPLQPDANVRPSSILCAWGEAGLCSTSGAAAAGLYKPLVLPLLGEQFPSPVQQRFTNSKYKLGLCLLPKSHGMGKTPHQNETWHMEPDNCLLLL